jgi:unsaturated rhamnogalacturonyl hydrolase
MTTVREVLQRVMRRTLEYDFTVWFWGDAIAIDGLLEAAELLDDSCPVEQCLRFYQAWSRRPLAWADHLTPGMGLLRLYQSTGEPALLAAAGRLARWLEAAPRASRWGAPLYRPDIPAYRHTVWVDTIYHEPSFFCRLARITGDTHYDDVALDVWSSHVNTLCSHDGPFLAHARDTGMRALRGYGWGRGNGWALYGMVDTLEWLPREHPGYSAALTNMQALAAAVLALQDASGFWRTLLHDREAYLESSTAAFYGGAFTRAVRLGLLDQAYAAAADRAWTAVVSRIDDEGSFFGVSACTYAATSPDDVISMYKTLPTEVNVWGQGSALRFAAERIRSGLDEKG